jgi:hypothetical protein
MRPDLVNRWKQEMSGLVGPLKTPMALFNRGLTADDFIDTAIIGGVSVADLVAGKVQEWQIPKGVDEAFHAQYPGIHGSLVEEVGKLSGHPDQIQGLINGVKGKLFEIDYVHWLNNGHLPGGFTAELAHNANNPAWDIAVRDAHGHINELLQMKATASAAYIHDTILAHPSIDVVVPHELYHQLASHSEFASHLVDSHQHLDVLTGHVSHGLAHAAAAVDHFHIPGLAVAFAVCQSYKRYRNGEMTLNSALQNAAERSLLALVASGVGWAMHLAAHSTLVGIPFAMGTRLAGSQLIHNRDRRKLLDMEIQIVRSSREQLQLLTLGS